MNGETLMKDDHKDCRESLKIRENCIEILNTYKEKLIDEIRSIQEKSKESKMKKSEFLLAKHKMDTQYDANNTLFSPYEKNMRQKEEEKLNILLHRAEECGTSYDQEILERQDHLKKIELLRECIESIEIDSQSILKIQELERKKVADDLQELIIHDLNRLIEKTETCSKACRKYPNRGKQGLDEISNSLKKIINSMKLIISNLYPTNISNIGLAPAIESYLKGIEKMCKIPFYLEINEEGHEPNDIMDMMVFRIIQEICHQIIKNSEVRACKIILKYMDDRTLLTIEGEGAGVEFLKESNLFLTKEMVSQLSGEYQVSSVDHESKKLVISIPLRKAEI